MKRNIKSMVLLALIVTLSVLSIAPGAEAQSTENLKVAVSIAPLAGIVENVGGAFIETTVLLAEGVEPHAYTVDPSVIAAADEADLLVLTGHYHWEADIASQTSTPFISMDSDSGLESYEDYGARLSPMPSGLDNGHTPSQDEHEEGNPHGWWLLPTNAIAIANATRAALATLNSTLSSVWSLNLDRFVGQLSDFQDFVDEQDQTYGFSDMHAVAVFPAEAYVAETFGIQIDAVLMEESLTISGQELLVVQESLRNGTVTLILGSDVAKLQAGGEFAYQLIQDYGGTLVWVKAVFFSGIRDYLSIMTYNLGALTSGLEDRAGSTADPAITLLFGGLAGVLGIIVIVETLVIIRRARME